MRKYFVRLYYLLGGKKGSYLQQKWSHVINERHAKIGRIKLQKYGIEMLTKFHEACNACNVKGWLEFGTLLGAYREHSFIGHDFDLDVGMMQEDYTQSFHDKLCELGFKLHHGFYLMDTSHNKSTLTEVTYFYEDFNIDIFLSKSDNSKLSRRCYVYIVGEEKCPANEYILPNVGQLQEVIIDNHVFNSPENVVKTLKIIYGDSFMIPDPTWRTASEKNKNVSRMEYPLYHGIKKYLKNIEV